MVRTKEREGGEQHVQAGKHCAHCLQAMWAGSEEGNVNGLSGSGARTGSDDPVGEFWIARVL